MARVGNRVIFDLRAALFRRMQVLGLKTYDQMGVGRMMSRIQNDVTVLEDFLSTGMISVLSDILTLFGVIFAMLALNLRLALISYTVMPLMFVVMYFWRRRAVQTYRATRITISRVTGNFAENINGMRVVQSFGREERNLVGFRVLNQENLDANADAARLSAFLFPAVELLSAMATAIVLFFGGLSRHQRSSEHRGADCFPRLRDALLPAGAHALRPLQHPASLNGRLRAHFRIAR